MQFGPENASGQMGHSLPRRTRPFLRLGTPFVGRKGKPKKNTEAILGGGPMHMRGMKMGLVLFGFVGCFSQNSREVAEVFFFIPSKGRAQGGPPFEKR